MLDEILKEKRKALNMTQQDLADQLHVTRQTVSSWEVGKSIPDISSLIEISKLYDISLDYMLKGDNQVTEKLKKDTVELNLLRFFSKSTLVVISILLILLFPISVIFIALAIIYITIFKKQSIRINTKVSQPSKSRKRSSYLGESLTDSLSLIGGITIFLILVSFLFKNNQLFSFNEQSKIFLLIVFVGRTLVNYYRIRKGIK